MEAQFPDTEDHGEDGISLPFRNKTMMGTVAEQASFFLLSLGIPLPRNSG